MANEQILYQDPAAGERHELQPELMSMMKEEVGKARERRMPIIRAFEAVAERSGLKANTIRNYYYRYIHTHDDTTNYNTVTGSEVTSLDESIGRPFTPEETRELMREMLMAQARGESVRGCANRLSGGDKRVLIRLQNKYRSIIAREPEYVENLLSEMKAEGVPCFNPYARNRTGLHADRLPGRTGNTDGQLIDWVGQFVSNMKSIRVASVNDLIRGLRDLSSLAAGHSDYRHENELQDLNNRIILLETSLERERRELSGISRRLNSLMEINRRFVNMNDSEKLSNLKDYVDQLQNMLQTAQM